MGANSGGAAAAAAVGGRPGYGALILAQPLGREIQRQITPPARCATCRLPALTANPAAGSRIIL